MEPVRATRLCDAAQLDARLEAEAQLAENDGPWLSLCRAEWTPGKTFFAFTQKGATLTCTPDGTREWRMCTESHPLHTPAGEECGGARNATTQCGTLHRVGAPAVEERDGTRIWYDHGKRHRVDGPAYECPARGLQMWYLNDKLHRVDGPARVFEGSECEWYFEDELHREDGPAVERADGFRKWCIHGKLHRVDGPAREDPARGVCEWFFEGEPHRVGGPAFDGGSMLCIWYDHGKKHRIGGPAVYGTETGTEWWENGQRHRIGGPAIEYRDGTRSWYVRGKEHREDGPAFESPDGSIMYFLNGEFLSEKEWRTRTGNKL